MLEDKIIETNGGLSRRNFLVKAGALTAGMAVAGGFFGASYEKSAEAAFTTIPYTKLDVEAVRAYGFEGYKKLGGCMIGSAYGLLHVLRGQLNHDVRWDAIDESLFKYGAGGVNSWGTLCGALNGSLFVMSLAMPFSDLKKIGNELISWYCKFPFPSPMLANGTKPALYTDAGTGYVKLNEKCFIPNAGVTKPTNLTTSESTSWDSRIAAAGVSSVAGSPLCHVSVSTWSKAAATATGTYRTISGTDKSDRCGRLTGDVAAKAAVILNQYLTGRYRATATNTVATNYCMTCHAPGNVPKNEGYKFPNSKDDEQGKMPCVECHTDEAVHDTQMNGDADCGTCHNY